MECNLGGGAVLYLAGLTFILSFIWDGLGVPILFFFNLNLNFEAFV